VKFEIKGEGRLAKISAHKATRGKRTNHDYASIPFLADRICRAFAEALLVKFWLRFLKKFLWDLSFAKR